MTKFNFVINCKVANKNLIFKKLLGCILGNAVICVRVVNTVALKDATVLKNPKLSRRDARRQRHTVGRAIRRSRSQIWRFIEQRQFWDGRVRVRKQLSGRLVKQVPVREDCQARLSGNCWTLPGTTTLDNKAGIQNLD